MFPDTTADNLIDALAALAGSADTAAELYTLMIGLNAVVAERAAEIRDSTPVGTEDFNLAIQAAKDFTDASDNARRMSTWYDLSV